jgi:hypothetical protein
MAQAAIHPSARPSNTLDAFIERLPASSIWLPLVLMGIAFLVRIPDLAGLATRGDEWWTVREVIDFSNRHALSYFVFLRGWTIIGGDSHEWLRLFSVLCGTLSVGAIWWWLKPMRGSTIAVIAALLLALSPLSLQYSRSLRFYSYHILMAVLFFGVYARVVFSHTRPSRGVIAVLLIVGILFATSHLMGWVLLGLVVVHTAIFKLKLPRWVYLGAVVLAIGGFVVLLLSPELINQLYQFAQRAGNGAVIREYVGGRGITLVTFGKLGTQYHNFVLGSNVYIFDLVLVVPALLLASVLSMVGLWRLWRTERAAFGWILIGCIGFILLLYGVFDSFLPADASGSVTVRYTVAAFPLFIWLIAEGIAGLGRWLRPIGLVAFVGISVAGIASYYNPTFENKDDLFLALFDVAADAETRPLTLIVDGRASESVEYIVPTRGTTTIIRPQALDTAFAQLPNGGAYWISNDWRRQFACENSAHLGRLSQWEETYQSVRFPQFVYGYEIGTPATIRADGALPTPRTLFDLRYQDLTLPRAFTWDDEARMISGVFPLPSCTGDLTWESMTLNTDASGILIASHLVGDAAIPNGTQIATLTVMDAAGTMQTFPLYKDQHSQSWNTSACANCLSIMTWRKYIHLVGGSRYPEAYNDFTAHIWGTEIAFPAPIDVQAITLTVEPLPDDAQLNVWGLYQVR